MQRIVTTVVLLSALGASAQVPFRLSYQGRLTAMDGTPVTGPQPFTFSLFTAPTGGVPVWTEAQTVLVTNGLYAAILGDVSSCDAGSCAGIPPAVFTGADLYLELSVASVPMTPRQRVTSVPYAVRSYDVAGGTAAVTSASVSGDLTVDGQARLTSVRTRGGSPVIDTSGKYVGPAIVSAVDGGGVLLGPTGALSLPTCALGGSLRVGPQGWECAPPAPDAGLLVYLCPSIADDCSGGSATITTPCGGQLTSNTTCGYRVIGGAGSCQGRSTACTAAGRINPLP